MSEYDISPEISGRVNATNYDIADMLSVINGDPVTDSVDLEVEIEPD